MKYSFVYAKLNVIIIYIVIIYSLFFCTIGVTDIITAQIDGLKHIITDKTYGGYLHVVTMFSQFFIFYICASHL